MAMRLSELLERIRPAGTPGAAGDAETAGERALEDELAAVVAELATYDAEADRILDDARRSAADALADAERRAQAVCAAQADRVAVAGATGVAAHMDGIERERRRIAEEAAAEVDGVRRRADERRDQVAAHVIDVIWSSMSEVGS